MEDHKAGLPKKTRAFEAINEEKIRRNEKLFARLWAKAGSGIRKNTGISVCEFGVVSDESRRSHPVAGGLFVALMYVLFGCS